MLTIGRVQQAPHDFLIRAYWWTTSRATDGTGACFVQYYLPEYDVWLSEIPFDGAVEETEALAEEDSPFVYQMPLEQRIVTEGLVSHPELQVVALLQALLEGRAGRVSSGGIEIAHMEEHSSEIDEDGVHCTTYRVGLWGPHWGVALSRGASRYTATFVGF